MRTLFAAYRASDLEQLLAFYSALGYQLLGWVAFDDGGRLAVLSFQTSRWSPWNWFTGQARDQLKLASLTTWQSRLTILPTRSRR